MDNPNASCNLRRCNSLPLSLRRPSLYLRSRLQKTNPYVGSFRHAPPTSFRSMAAGGNLDTTRVSAWRPSSSCIAAGSPYVGWFRHAPSSNSENVRDRALAFQKEIQRITALVESLPRKNLALSKKVPNDLWDIISGKLSGGIEDRFYQQQRFLINHTRDDFTGPALQALAKMSTWFLFPIAVDKNAYDYPLSSLHSETRSEDDTSYEPHEDAECSSISDDEESVGRGESRQSADRADISLSETVETFYAHQSISTAGLTLESLGHIDDVITQMDIVRIARNASRHLDLDSIITLPTVIEQAPHSRSMSPIPCISEEALSMPCDPGWSWMMVDKSLPTEEGEKEEITTRPVNGRDRVCVICLETFREGDKLRVLPCNHRFHVSCIDRWLSGSSSDDLCDTSGCPTCKKRPYLQDSVSSDGSVPSWAFAQLGDALARQGGSQMLS